MNNFFNNILNNLFTSFEMQQFDPNNEYNTVQKEKNSTGNNAINAILPNDMLLEIFSYLSRGDANNISLVCKDWNKINLRNPVYRELFQKLTQMHFREIVVSDSKKTHRENVLNIQYILKQTASEEILGSFSGHDKVIMHSIEIDAFIDYSMKSGSHYFLNLDKEILTLIKIENSEKFSKQIPAKGVKSAQLSGDHILCMSDSNDKFADWIQVYRIDNLEAISLEDPQENGKWLKVAENHGLLCAISEKQIVMWHLVTGKVENKMLLMDDISECQKLEIGKEAVAAFTLCQNQEIFLLWRTSLDYVSHHTEGFSTILTSRQNHLVGFTRDLGLHVYDLDQGQSVFGYNEENKTNIIPLCKEFILINQKVLATDSLGSLIILDKKEPKDRGCSIPWKGIDVFGSALLLPTKRALCAFDVNAILSGNVHPQIISSFKDHDKLGEFIRFDSYLRSSGCFVAVFEKGISVIEFKSISQLFKKVSNKND